MEMVEHFPNLIDSRIAPWAQLAARPGGAKAHDHEEPAPLKAVHFVLAVPHDQLQCDQLIVATVTDAPLRALNQLHETNP